MDEQDKGSFDPLNQSGPEQAAEQKVTPDKTDADYAAAARQAGNYIHSKPPVSEIVPNEHEHSGHLVISVIALVVLALIAAASYWFLLRHKSTANIANVQTTTSTKAIQASPAASQISTTTKSYTSPNFKLTFNYPSDWVVSDNGGGMMTVKSPTLQLKNAAGQSTNGTIILTVRDHAQKLNEFNAGNATAVRDSVKVAYSQPTPTQRANTYISFLQYAATRATGALDGIYITADNGYQKGQAIPLVDVQKVDPIISITFLDSSGKALSVTNTMWDDSNFSGPLSKLLQSFSIT